MSSVVNLPPRPAKRYVRSVVAWLRSVLARSWKPRRDVSGEVYPIAAGGPLRRPDRPSQGTLQVRSRRSGDQRVLELCGTLDQRTQDGLADALEQALEGNPDRICLDLRHVESVDRAAIDPILTAHLRANDQFTAFVIVPGRPQVQRVLDQVEGPFAYATLRAERAPGITRSRGRLPSRQARGSARPRDARRTR